MIGRLAPAAKPVPETPGALRSLGLLSSGAIATSAGYFLSDAATLPYFDPRTGGDTGLLVPAAPGTLEAYPVSTLVSNVRNNGPELLEPLPLEEVPQ